MKQALIPFDRIITSTDLVRAATAKQFEERLESSIEAMGLAEPLKVARLPRSNGEPTRYVIIDGVLRWQAVRAIRRRDPHRFERIPAYVVDFAKRFEIRYQTDIYQDLLPSQLASLVEHLHQTEHVSKRDIALYLGVSPATLRNYTGLWRLVQRGGLSEQVVLLMDVGVLPSSNPYAWLRLTEAGIRRVFSENFTDGARVESWIEERIRAARLSPARPYPLKFVEAVTGSLPENCYRGGSSVREMKQQLGLRRATGHQSEGVSASRAVMSHLAAVSETAESPVLRLAAEALRAYVK